MAGPGEQLAQPEYLPWNFTLPPGFTFPPGFTLPPLGNFTLPPWLNVTLPQLPGNRTIEACERAIRQDLFVHASLGPALFIIVVLSFLEKRTNGRSCTSSGRPGFIIPLNMLDGHKHRWPYAIAFCCMTNSIVSIFLGGDVYFTRPAPPIVQMIVGMLAILELCLSFYPFFACLATRHTFIGALLGFLYTSTWGAVRTLYMLECINPIPKLLPYFPLFIQWPEIGSFLYLVITFLRILVQEGSKPDLDKNLINPKDAPLDIASPHHFEHVSCIFRKPVRKEVSGCQARCDSICKCIYTVGEGFLPTLYKNIPHFKYSTIILCTLMVVLSVMYQLGVVYFWLVGVLLEWLRRGVKQGALFVAGGNNETHDTLMSDAEVLFDAMFVSWHVITAIAFILLLVFLYNFLQHHRSNLLRMAKGDKSFLPKYQPSAAETTAKGMRYAGYQVAFMIWGFLILHLTTWVLTILFTIIIIIPLTHDNTTIVVTIFQIFILPLILSTSVYYLQYFAAKHVILQEKVEKYDEDQPLALKERKIYHNYTYYMFLANVPMGFFSCLFRILKGALLGILLIGRIDRSVLMPGFEEGDKGYMAYLGLLTMEHTHTHPILRVFCHLLLEHTKHMQKDGLITSTEDEEHIMNSPKKKEVFSNINGCWAKKRWQLAYTLINNPDLIESRQQILQLPTGDDNQATNGIPCRATLTKENKIDIKQLKLHNLERNIHRLKGEITSASDDFNDRVYIAQQLSLAFRKRNPSKNIQTNISAANHDDVMAEIINFSEESVAIGKETKEQKTKIPLLSFKTSVHPLPFQIVNEQQKQEETVFTESQILHGVPAKEQCEHVGKSLDEKKHEMNNVTHL